MRILMTVVSLAAIAAPGCIIYETDDCDGCGWDEDEWDDGDWCDTEDDSSDCGTDTDEDTEEPAYTLSFAPGQAERGETFVGHLSVEGDFEVAAVTGVRFTGGLDALWFEVRGEELRILVDVPYASDLGAVDLVVSRGEGPAVLVEGALVISEEGSGASSSECE